MIDLPAWAVMNVYTIILLILLIYFNKRNRQKTIQVISFRNLLYVLLFTLIGDSLSRLPMDSLFGSMLRPIGTFMIFALDPICYCFIIFYIEKCAGMFTHSLMTKLICFPLAAANLLGLILNQLFDLHIFYYFENNVGYRGIFFLERAVLMLSLCFMMEIFIFLHRKDFQQSYCLPISFLPVLVLFFGALQVIFGGIGFQYMGITLSCLLLFIYIQNRDVNEDYLTGVSNRRGIYGALNYAIRDRRSHLFAAIMLDLDKFKQINDQFGHQSGDQALIDLASILRECFRKSDTIGRIGGDEFCVLLNLKKIEDLDAAIRRLRATLIHFNETNHRPYQLMISLGAAVYQPELWSDADSFLSHVDSLLYEEKKKHHAMLAQPLLDPNFSYNLL